MLSRRRRSASRTRDPSCTVTKVRFPSFSPHLRVVVSAREEGGTDFRLFLTDHQPHPISTTQFLTCTGQKEVGKNKKIKDCGIRYCERCTLKRYVFLSPSPSPLLMNQTDDTSLDATAMARTLARSFPPELPRLGSARVAVGFVRFFLLLLSSSFSDQSSVLCTGNCSTCRKFVDFFLCFSASSSTD
jgi:hypothetical protein